MAPQTSGSMPPVVRDAKARRDSSAEPAFYAPRGTDEPYRFVLDAAPALCVGPPERQFLMGGVGLAAAIAAMERVTERPLVWATAQYLSYAQPGNRLDLSVEIPVSGRHVSQARVASRVGDREILSVAGALGGRAGSESAQFARPPEAPPPDACEPRGWRHDATGTLLARFERRRVATHETEGRAIQWMRACGGPALDAGLLAIVADFFAGGLELTEGAMSLDNTIRIHRLPGGARAGWLLCDTRFAGIDVGSFHGEMRIFDEVGALLATASQSAILPRSEESRSA